MGSQLISLAMLILSCIYFMLPAYVANMTPVFFRGVNFLSRPVDFGCKLRDGQRLFGKNKTWRGLIFGTVAGLMIFILQKQLYGAGVLGRLAVLDYSIASLWIGIGLGFGALFGDLFGSFAKRRLKIREGKDSIFLDQLDFVFGALIFSFWLLTWPEIVMVLIVSPLLHLLANYVGYRFRIRTD